MENQNTKLRKGFNQVFLIPDFPIVKTGITETDDILQFKIFMAREYKIRVQYLEELELEGDNFKCVCCGEKRKDLLIAVHDEDLKKIMKFPLPVFAIEDIVSNNEAIFYPSRIAAYHRFHGDVSDIDRKVIDSILRKTIILN